MSDGSESRTRVQDSDEAEVRSQLDAIRTAADRKRQQRWQGLLDAAASLGIEQSEFEGGLPGGYESVIREAVGEQGLDFQNGRWSAAQWVFVSGMSHPSMSRAWSGSIQNPGEVGPDGLIPVLSEPNPTVVRDAFGLALAPARARFSAMEAGLRRPDTARRRRFDADRRRWQLSTTRRVHFPHRPPTPSQESNDPAALVAHSPQETRQRPSLAIAD